MDVDLPTEMVSSNEGVPEEMEAISAAPEQPIPFIEPVLRKKTFKPAPPVVPTRTLRARHSDITPTTSTSTTSPTQPLTNGHSTASTSPNRSFVSNGPVRRGTAKEIALIQKQLGPEALSLKKEEKIHALEGKLRGVMDRHDMAVREKFHLERYVLLLEGWIPEEIKKDNSPVFTEWRSLNRHNLSELLPASSLSNLNGSTNAQAGPSRSRGSLPARTTRRAAHEQSEAFSSVIGIKTSVVPPETVNDAHTISKGKGKTTNEQPIDIKSKGKAKAVEEVAEEAVFTTGKGKKRASMDPPPLPTGTSKSKNNRRQTLPAPMALPEEEGEEIIQPVETLKGGKKRIRQSLPNLPAAKKGRLKATTEEISSSPAPSRTEEPGAHEPDPLPSPALPIPTQLPSLSHLSFEPPPKRPKHRYYTGPIWYTDPSQLPPLPNPKWENWNDILQNYIHLEDTGPIPDLVSLQNRAAREGYIRNRVNYLIRQGRLSRLVDEQTQSTIDTAHPGGNTTTKKGGTNIGWKDPSRKTDHQDSLMSHMIQVRNAMIGEAKAKPILCKRIARMITTYWERIEGREERELLMIEREQKRKNRELVKAIRKRWGLAVKIIRARYLEMQKAEQDRLGKEHLQNMLQRSTGLLEAQRDDIVQGQGQGRKDGEGSDSEDSDDSEGTDEVSAAEASGAEEDEANDGGNAMNGEDEGEKDDPHEDDAQLNGVLVDDTVRIGDEIHAGSDIAAEVEGEEEDDEGSESDNEDTAERGVDLRALLSDGMDLDSADMDVDVDEDVDEDKAGDELAAETSEVEDSEGDEDEDIEDEDVPDENDSERLTESNYTPKVNGTSKEYYEPDSSPDPLDLLPTTPSKPTPRATPSKQSLSQSKTLPISRTSIINTVHIDQEESPQPSPSIAKRSLPHRKRKRRRIPVQKESLGSDDPDANDIEFAEEATSDREDEDLEYDLQMEEEDEGGFERKGDGDKEVDSEDEGLLADADIPIEELLKRYGYMVSAETGDVEAEETVDEEKEEDLDKHQSPGKVNGSMNVDMERAETRNIAVDQPPKDQTEPLIQIKENNGYPQTLPLGNGVPANSEEVIPDQSLTDQNIGSKSPEAALIIEGKRQRRPRTLWSPSDEAVQVLRKPKIEVVDPEANDWDSPTQTSSEEEDSDEEDEEEDDAEEELEGETDELGEGDHGPKLRPPFLLRGTLRPYQQAGLEWLASLYANNMNGILADEMGLGKTIQTIALLAHLACDKGVWGQHLIIVPTSVILNWEMEFKKFFPGMKVLTYYGSQKERKEKRIGWHTDHTWQVCITSYQIVLADQHIFRRKSWVYMILDEAHNIKNFRSQRWQTLLGFKASRRLLLTGTPLQNNLMELWSLLYFLMPQGIAAEQTAVVGFANHKDFMEWFSNPMDKAVESGETLDTEMLATVSKLHTLLRPFILRRLKSEVETQLPGKFEHVVYCKLSKRQRFLYDEFMNRASTKEALISGGYLGVVNTLMQLRKVCNHPDLFEVRNVRTSFVMERSVLTDFEIKDLLIRRRLLRARAGTDTGEGWGEFGDQLDFDRLGLRITDKEERSAWTWNSIGDLEASDKLPFAIEEKKKGKQPTPPKMDTRTVEGWLRYRQWVEDENSKARWRIMRDINRRRCRGRPVYGSTLLSMLTDIPQRLLPLSAPRSRRDLILDHTWPASELVKSYTDRAKMVSPLVDMFAVIPPNAVARDLPGYALPTLQPTSHPSLMDPEFDTLHQATVKLQIAFPDASLLQYDCGKLQKLYEMLRTLKSQGHRVLIFTQMTKVLDILEMFLSYNGHRYLRLDGSTKIEDRQIITERFNSDTRIFCFIASSRSGGVGINLTGADTVFFYDSDWNPSMDRQCMDRAHRIGQTREVHIYRFVSSFTVEENMLKKANQKRLLDRVVIQQGDFTTEFFGKMDWRDIIDDPSKGKISSDLVGGPEVGGEGLVGGELEREGIDDIPVEGSPEAEDVVQLGGRYTGERELANVFAQVEDEEDVVAARIAQGEGEMDIAEFLEAPKKLPQATTGVQEKRTRFEVDEHSTTPVTPAGGLAPSGTGELVGEGEAEPELEEEEDEPGGLDEYMLAWVEADWNYFINYKS